ncbi:MAG: transketolase [Candidatus Magasanikbacteria bacterium]|nr:transketolase [Candidatus Magasanikbacteria bacterium]
MDSKFMQNNLVELAKLIRFHILTSTTAARSGHPSSSLSATDLMTVLMFSGFFKADLDHPANPNNDRLIFSKGHAAPLFYSLYAVAGKVSAEEMLTLRQFGSRLEGHPTMYFPYTEAGTGSLGQGLSIGLGMALNAKLDKLPYKTYVLLGDSEMAEGSVWEAMQLAAHYKLDNLVGIIDVNRLGQRGETMYGHDVEGYAKRVSAFGWETIVIDGHEVNEIETAFSAAQKITGKPVMIIAKTLKGKGVSFIENKDGWHGKPLNKEECEKALLEIGEVDKKLVGKVASPPPTPSIAMEGGREPSPSQRGGQPARNGFAVAKSGGGGVSYKLGDLVATRKAYGNALVRLMESYKNLVVLDAEVSNSTYSEFVKKTHPERFFEMYIAEQNMVGAALGFSRRGKIPFVSTFAAFFARAFDQIRMSQYAMEINPDAPSAVGAGIKFVGSHAGVSIGEDGASQMALEDLAIFRAILGSVVMYPSDAVSCERIAELAADTPGNFYIRTTRKETLVLYSPEEKFVVGGSKVLRESKNDAVTVVGAGVTLHEALKAYEELQKEKINIRVIDLYSIKPLDTATLQKVAEETKAIITVEDHYAEGGLGEAVASAFVGNAYTRSLPRIEMLAVRKMPRSGKPAELLAYEEIDAAAIVKLVKKLL